MAARERISHYVHRTPVLTNSTLNLLASTPRTAAELRGTEWELAEPDPASAAPAPGTAKPTMRLFFKCENLQRIGAFKVRGAFHALGRLIDTTPGGVDALRARGGVVTHSSGNHAQALALAARTFDVPCTIVMPSISPAAKVAATKGYGARVVFSGSTAPEREKVCAEVMQETGAVLVPPYDHPDIVLGQGTLAIEMLEQVEQLLAGEKSGEEWEGGMRAPATRDKVYPGTGKRRPDAVLVPCGGGGMLSGVALACSGDGDGEDKVRVFGCEPSFEGADDAGRGFRAGSRVTSVSSLTVADGLRTPLGDVNWGVIYERRLVSDFYAVGELEIRRALRLVLERLKLVVEPSAVVPLAVALYNEDFRRMVEREAGPQGWDVCVVFSGGNVGMDVLGDLLKDTAV